MSKKVNPKTVAPFALASFSDYHKAYVQLVALRKDYKSDIEKLNIEKSKILESREEAIKGGMSLDDALSKYSIDDVDCRINARTFKYDEDCKPYNESQSKLRSMIRDDLYDAYVLAMRDASMCNLNLVGTVQIPKGKKTVTKVVSVGYVSQIKNFAETIGFTNVKDDNAVKKFATTIAVRAGGMLKDNKGGYLKMRSNSSFKDVVILAIIQYCVQDVQKWEVTADNGLKIVESAEAFN